MIVTTASRETLQHFADLLLDWNRTVNLISRQAEPFLWPRHIDDSLALVPLIPASTDRGIDLGTGAGFPGFILALVTGIPFDLIESDRRKAAFLQNARLRTGAPVRIHAARIETLVLPPASLVTARALAPLPDLLRLAAPKLAADGVCLFPKGRDYAPELTAARREWHMTVDCIPGVAGVVLKVSELRRVPPCA